MLLLALLVGLTLIGCAPGPAIDLDGPGNVEGGKGPAEEPGSEETTTEPAKPATVPNFKQKFTYEDGVAIEVIKIEKGRLTPKQAEEEYNEKVKAGNGFARFTIKITNGSKEVLPADLVYVTASYGPDGTQPEEIYFGDATFLEGKILPEKSKSGRWSYAIPQKYWNDVTMEIAIQDDLDRESVIFTGSIK
jgi:hypothetical protein